MYLKEPGKSNLSRIDKQKSLLRVFFLQKCLRVFYPLAFSQNFHTMSSAVLRKGNYDMENCCFPAIKLEGRVDGTTRMLVWNELD
jgi:hypothetical protein